MTKIVKKYFPSYKVLVHCHETSSNNADSNVMESYNHGADGLWAGLTSVGGLSRGHASSGVLIYSITQKYL